jgi:hypothetical protein
MLWNGSKDGLLNRDKKPTPMCMKVERICCIRIHHGSGGHPPICLAPGGELRHWKVMGNLWEGMVFMAVPKL